MRILVTGGGGFIGKKLAARLLADGKLGNAAIKRLVLADTMPVTGLDDAPVLETRTFDITDKAAVDSLIGEGFDVVFHLAAIVSANAETDFELGYRVNLDGTRHLLEALRAAGNKPTLVFASSAAVYGGDVPPVLTDQTHLTPQTSYGVQKAASELLVADYHRKGFIDGRSLRLPTIVVRPGKPNKAASTFASSILREPLAGQTANCPVRLTSAMYILSPRRVVDAFIHGALLESAALGMTRSLLLPGITVTIGEMLAALEKIAGPKVAGRVTHEPDPLVQKIVDGWPPRFDVRRAAELGFRGDESIEAIITAHIEDELGGKIAD